MLFSPSYHSYTILEYISNRINTVFIVTYLHMQAMYESTKPIQYIYIYMRNDTHRVVSGGVNVFSEGLEGRECFQVLGRGSGNASPIYA